MADISLNTDTYLEELARKDAELAHAEEVTRLPTAEAIQYLASEFARIDFISVHCRCRVQVRVGGFGLVCERNNIEEAAAATKATLLRRRARWDKHWRLDEH